MECTLSKSTSIQASHTNRRKVAEQVVIETLEGRNVEVGDFIMVPALSDPEQVSGKIILRIIGVNLKGRLMYGHSSEESRCKLME